MVGANQRLCDATARLLDFGGHGVSASANFTSDCVFGDQVFEQQRPTRVREIIITSLEMPEPGSAQIGRQLQGDINHFGRQ